MDPSSTQNRVAALDQLRHSRSLQSFPSHPSATHQHQPYAPSAPYQPPAPPAQSRDASAPSGWNPSTNAPYGNVLVPSSSPLGADAHYRTGQSSQSPYGTMPNLPPATQNPWSRPALTPTAFGAGVPSGFAPASGASAPPVRHPNPQVRAAYGMDVDSAESRKRGRPQDLPARVPATPESPDVQRPGQRRRLAPSDSPVSDDPFADAGANGAPQRLVRARPDADFENDQRFRRFKVTQPLHGADRVKAAWDEARGNVPGATALLEDPTWSPRTSKAVALPAPTSAPTIKPETGRVKEVDEANQAARQVQREKAKKSAIYQNRIVLEKSKVVPSTVVAASPVKRASPPPSPVIALPRRPRKVAKRVVDSDSGDDFAESDDDRRPSKPESMEDRNEEQALKYFNTAGPEALQELSGCSLAQADHIIKLRPFANVEDLTAKLHQGKKRAGPGGISTRMFQDCTNIFAGYSSVDSVLDDCERIGTQLRSAIASWTSADPSGKTRSGEQDMGLANGETDDGALSLTALVPGKGSTSKDCLTVQPTLLSNDIKLKDYQLTGVSWLRLVYRKRLSCILADEMGLGKTAQVISFFASLKEQGNKGPHLVVVPSSTLENWCREFARFAPSIVVQTYYAGKDERPQLRQTLNETLATDNEGGWEVLITTYALAQGDDRDRKFFRKIEWDCCVFDEGHVLKNFQSQRYQALLRYESRWRLLLTGTPLQNNLQELVSLMNFILPDHFADSLDSLRAVFKVKGDSKVTLLAQERVSRAKKMMTPFVLRRRKDQVLKDLPKKHEAIRWCEMTDLQSKIYRDTIRRSRKTIMEAEPEANLDEPVVPGKGKGAAKKKKPAGKTKEKQYAENSSNVLMDLRKAALHPLLFRTHFHDKTLDAIARLLVKEPEFIKRGSVVHLMKEDMEVMTDSEMQNLCGMYKSTTKFALKDDVFYDSGKVAALIELLREYKEQGRRVLVFSQFTQVLRILEGVLDRQQHKYLLLTGDTAVDLRQSLVDEFTEDESISVFLLSTKAGGMGINLTAASVVIMFDQDFNPHNDRQAQDRAYRIGQKVDVDVIKLISRGTIEEDMLRLGDTKLALDEAVAGDTEEGGADDSAATKRGIKSLIGVLRKQIEDEDDVRPALPKPKADMGEST